MRVPFLVLAPACVLVGLGTAVWTTGRVSVPQFLLALLGGLTAHVAVNALNEYFDYRSGLDARTQRTPFSGGSGTLPAQPELARPALALALTALAVTGLIGLYFVAQRGVGLLPLGVLGLVVIVAYTPWFARLPTLSLISPGLGFGTLMVMGTDYVLTGAYSWTAFAASLVPFFLVNNLLLLNQFPDMEADRSVGRHNYVILLGRPRASRIYTAFMGLTYLSVIGGVLLRLLPVTALLALLTVPLAVRASRDAQRFADDPPRLIPAQGQNVMVNLLTPTLLAIGLLIG
jgi:1,4-dihydroxy-2-naphthoate octaprenyltransferase